MLTKMKPLILTVCFLVAGSCSISHADLLYNGDFEIVGSNPTGTTTFHEGQSPNMPSDPRSAADGWNIWHNVFGTTETTLVTYADAGLPTIHAWQDPFSDHVLRVEASHALNGLVNTWEIPGSGPQHALGEVYIFVPSAGQLVGVGIGNGGATMLTDYTSGVGGAAGWERIQFIESNSPVNEMTIYAASSGAEFYVDLARVSAVPEPASLGILGLISCGLASLRRRV